MSDELGEPLTPQEIEAFLKRYAAGDPVAEIAADVNVSVGTIVAYASRRRVWRPENTARRSQHHTLTEEQLAELRVAYPDRDRPVAEIAAPSASRWGHWLGSRWPRAYAARPNDGVLSGIAGPALINICGQ
ncbi:hypothetical protein [Nonomuraea sp. 10N515B]|uniref:hypothetical protein n=1 Tax=Nonomuraea sp. 10N515B TaxID=3457422 RepID=UPI003FCEB0D4